MYLRGLIVLCLTPGCLTGCENPASPGTEVPDVRAWVTGPAAANLDGQGRFRLPAPCPPGSAPITSPEGAASLTEAFLRLFAAPGAGNLGGGSPSGGIGGVSIRDVLQHQRGAPISFPALVPAERVYFAESPYAPVPDTIPVYVRKYLGPFFLVPFLEAGDPAVVMASSAYNTDMRLENGRLILPPIHGNDFYYVGIPTRAGFVMPVTPEHAVKTVWEATRTRVRDVPVLIAPGRLFFPHYARWRITLEHRVRARGLQSGHEYATDELYVSGRVRSRRDRGTPVRDLIEVALPEQPTADTVPYPPLGTPDERKLVVGIRPGIPLRFESVQIGP